LGNNQSGVLELEHFHSIFPEEAVNSPVNISTGSGACPVFIEVIVKTGLVQGPLAWMSAT